MESAAACSSWPLVYILFQISAKKSARKNRILIKEETLAEIFFHQRSRKFFKSASQKGLTSIRCCSFFVAKFAILPGPSYSCEFLVIFETEFTWELWGSLEKLQWMWLNWVRTGLETERSYNIFSGQGMCPANMSVNVEENCSVFWRALSLPLWLALPCRAASQHRLHFTQNIRIEAAKQEDRANILFS